MGDRRCCCECIEYSDNFNRDDSNDLGDNWVEADEPNEPTWQRVVDNSVELTYNWVRYVTPAPGVAVNISVKLLTISDEQEYGVRFGWDIVNNDYWLVTYRSRGPVTNAQIRIYSVVGGVETLEYDSDGEIPGPDRCPGIWVTEQIGVTEDDTITLYICYTGSTVSAYTSGAVPIHACCLDEAAERYVGLETRSSNTLPIRFDDFFVQDHYLNNPECPDCGCLSMDFCPFPTLTLTIHMLENPLGCTTYWTDGDSIPLTRLENLFEWYPDGTLFTCFQLSNPQGDTTDLWFYVRVYCESGVWSLQYMMSTEPYDFCDLHDSPYWTNATTYSVSPYPFIVEFRISNPATPCCAWMMSGPDYIECSNFTISLILTQ